MSDNNLNASSSKSFIIIAQLALIATAIIHGVEISDAFEEQKYKGILFLLNTVGAVLSAILIRSKLSKAGWTLGYLVSTGALAGYIISRTFGLPGIPAAGESFLEPLGMASVVAELIFVGAFYLKNRDTQMLMA